MRAFNFLLAVSLASLLGSALSSPIETDAIDKQNLALLSKFIEEIRAPAVIDHSQDLRADVLVTIKNGTLQGKMETTGPLGTGKKYYAYKKVPYAAPPVGPLRFEPPQPSEAWSGVRNARVQTPGCAQFMTSITPSTEDCLFLNIFTPRPANASGDLLPVMVFIHGGAFVFGEAATYGPTKLINTPNDVVLVIVQYRLQAFGFLSTGDENLPGNMGMKDQVQALRWVQENIEAFGGDKTKVTLFGESAGAASSIYMLISPLAQGQGLFSKVIAQSGSALAEWAIDRNPWQNAAKLAGQVGCPNTTSSELVSCMKTVPTMKLARAATENTIYALQRMRVELPGSSPVIEGNVPGAFLTDDPLKLFNEGPLPDIPIIMGAVQNEGTLPVAGFYFLTLEREDLIEDPVYMHDFLIGELIAAYGPDDHINGGSLSQSVALAFMPDSDRENFDEMVYELIDLLSVLFMKAPVLRTAEILSRRIPNNLYFYSFEHYGSSSLYGLIALALPIVIPGNFPKIRPGVMHADDLQYQFPMPLAQSAADVNFGKIFCELWTNFATHGTPTPEATARYPAWPAFDIHSPNYLQLKLDSEVKVGYTKSWRQGIPKK